MTKRWLFPLERELYYTVAWTIHYKIYKPDYKDPNKDHRVLESPWFLTAALIMICSGDSQMKTLETREDRYAWNAFPLKMSMPSIRCL